MFKSAPKAAKNSIFWDITAKRKNGDLCVGFHVVDARSEALF